MRRSDLTDTERRILDVVDELPPAYKVAALLVAMAMRENPGPHDAATIREALETARRVINGIPQPVNISLTEKSKVVLRGILAF